MSMMMLGDRHRQHPIPTIQVPPWPVYDEPTSPYSPLPVSGSISASSDSPQFSPYLLGEASLAALSRFLPSNGDESSEDTLMDAYSCDEFRMYEFKVRRCARGRSHDWTECPYAHPGEKARRRDPRKYHYSGTACPDFRKGSCKRGDSCEFSHGVFECWLHPDRYRTQPCKDGVNCRRRVCFFAHTPEQLRVLPQQSPRACDSYDGSPMRHTHHYNHHHNTCLEAYLPKGFVMSSSPTSTLVSPPHSPPSDSPPLSPSAPPAVRRGSCSSGASSVNEVLVSLRKMQISKAKSSGSPLYGVGLMDGWDEPMERVESGRDLRVKMAERLSKENPLEGGPDVGWVSDLLN